MINSVRVLVPGKVNLALLVGDVDGQGYHELGTVFQAVSLGDQILAERAPEFSLRNQGEGSSFLPTDDTNLAIRAAKLLAERHGVDEGIRLLIRKRIPVAGGMAGGSADAAGVLVACNTVWNLGLSRTTLIEYAAELGADVPFLLLGGTAIGTGRGDIVTPTVTRGVYHWTFALAHGGLSTPAVFREFDRLGRGRPTEIPADLLAALAAGDVAQVGQLLTNDLTEAAVSLDPTLARTLELGREAGALGALVSGSGPTCAFLAGSEGHSQELAAKLALSSGVRSVRTAFGPVAGAQVTARW
ncbi:MAG TPA: 4-(cytidine 5'-diphospho)-2-C-methyl-D-erythritol kinase [Arachnia sp.]|nr:4-(cytidine 5'-diphospho)-2-C-methyl-D-erythritol kinase [Arachnia sp.]HMT86392.1 4-(cytidine 5'-diphospho)-2-C-methyl-D-erythritol kinase [Arachnia sp.]